MNNDDNVGISEKLTHSDHQMSTDEMTTTTDPVKSIKQHKEENIAQATPPPTANADWKALYRDIAAYAINLRQSNVE